MRRLLICTFLLLCCLPLAAHGEALPESRITYLYVPACQSCGKVAALLEELGEDLLVTPPDGPAFSSKLVVERVDISADPQLVEALFSRFGTPEQDQLVPSVYFGTSYLAGSADILSRLPEALARGEALTALPALEVSSRLTDSEPLRLGATITAGLVAGLNPCALSMLILLLGSLLHLGRRAWMLAGCFLLSKLSTYFLIGLVLLKLLQAWNPAALTLVLKLLLSLTAVLLIILNLYDAWQARQGRYGKVKNQLPLVWRRRLQGMIKQAAASRHLLWIMVLLGLAVSLGEFLCAGQLYLATLLATLHQGALDAGKLLTLAAYSLAFILPSALLTLVILRLQHTLEASDFIRRRMPLIKLLTALVLALALVYAWTV